MPEVVYYVAASLDGYIATADGGVDWLVRFQGTAEEHGAIDLHSSVDALLMGSHTYEFALKLGHLPSPDKPSWVFTRRDLRLLHPSITLTSQKPAEVIELLRARGVRRAWFMGGGELATSFRSRWTHLAFHHIDLSGDTWLGHSAFCADAIGGGFIAPARGEAFCQWYRPTYL